MAKAIKDMTLEELELEQRRLEARQAELNSKIRAERFKKYPKEVRAIMKKIGWAPEDTENIIHRTGSSFKVQE